jgi:branched-chain amino acid transport system substrate-binding protein
MRPKAVGIVLLLALTGTACAGDVVRYHNAAVGPDGVTIVAGDAAAASGAGEVAASVSVGASDAVVTDTTAVTEGAVPATPAGKAPSVTPTSGPAARYTQQAASSPAGPAAGRGPARVSSPGAPAPGAANGRGTGSSASSSSAGSVGPAPTPAPTTGGTTVGITKDTITLGVFYPRTGAYTGLARNAPAVADAAFQEAGPINGRRVAIKYYDDGTANASTIQVEERRARNEVFSLVSIVSESNVVLAPLADQHKVPLFVGNIDQKVALPLTYAFPLYPYWARQATILPGFIKNSLNAGSKKIGVVFEGTSTAIDAKNAFKDKAKEIGLSVVFEQPIAQNQSTCANEVANLQSHGVELVYMMNGPLGGICMLRDAKALGYKPTWTGVSPSWGFNVVAQASGGGADGVRMLRATPTLESPEGRHYTEIMRRYAPNSGAENDDLLLIFYALLRNVIEGLRRAGPDLTRESLVQTWETKMNGYDSGYLPPATFGPGNRSGPLSVGIAACCTDGKWTTPQQGWRATF